MDEKLDLVYAYPPRRGVPHLLNVATRTTLCGREPTPRWKLDTALLRESPQPSTCYTCHEAYRRRELVDRWEHRYDEPAHAAVAW